MDILGVGFSELVVILIIAMIVFGPRRLPEIAAKAGKIVRDLRSMSQGLLLEWQREITVASRLDGLEETRRELAELKKELSQTQREIGQQAQKEVKQFQKQVATEASKVEDALKIEDEPTGARAKPESDQPRKDGTQEMAPEEKSHQVSTSNSEEPQKREATPDALPVEESADITSPSEPIAKPETSETVKANGRPGKPAPSSEQPSHPKEVLNE